MRWSPSTLAGSSFAAPAAVLLFAAAVASQEPAQQEPAPQEPPVKPAAPDAQRPTNRLARETSPYLRLHQHNPVDWYPWGPEALARAKKEDKPIFLSIGYSACHWCHVMARESFEDPAVAAVMNEHYVCIKVDREERPDVDEIYMAALQAMGEQGGWPLSAWLLPDGRPFYGGTYFPPEDAHGRPAFRRVLEHLAKAWKEQRTDIEKGAGELAAHLQQALAPELQPDELSAALLEKVLPQARTRYDALHGGFGQWPHYAPKFPSARELQALLRLPDEKALEMVVKTLDAMAQGGIFDQLGGGFHRYSTDRAWIVPHFEKMLYDNALLVPCYLEAAGRTGEQRFHDVARATLDWLLREMQGPHGGFWASQDAQSEGVEGKFFVWRASEFDEALRAGALGDDAELLRRHYGVSAAGNWEGTNVLVLAQPADVLAKALDLPLVQVTERLERGRAALFARRALRVHPATDDKVICAWNGLTIGAMAAGYRWLGDARYLASARKAAEFALRELVVEGRCRRSWHSGKAPLPGFLEDHTMLAEGLLALFEVDADPRWLQSARDLLRTVLAQFAAEDAGFHFTAADQEPLLARAKSAHEGSTPSGTAAAANALLRCGLLLADEELYAAGVRALRANAQLIREAPASTPSLVLAVQFHLADPREIVIAGEPNDPRTFALLQAAWRAVPGHRVVALVHDGNREALAKLSPVFEGKILVDGAPAAYVCRRGVCEAPVTDPAKLGVAR